MGWWLWVTRSEVNLFLQHLQEEFDASPLLKPFFSHIVAFGPKDVDTNILVCDPGLKCSSAFPFNAALMKYYDTFIHKRAAEKEEVEVADVSSLLVQQFYTSIVSGFKLACESGPLCGELLWGVMFVIEDISLLPETPPNATEEELLQAVAEAKHATISQEDVMTQMKALNNGIVMSGCKQLCHMAYSQASPRLAEPMYRCVLQCSSEHLGKLYSVLNQRRGEVQSEDIWEGTDIFTITCILPVTESLGLANDLRQQTSGAVNQPQLQFSHWHVLDEDPFSKPTTEEEIEEWGDSFATKNKAYQIVNAIRKRKGMQTEEKIVENAEKQRTLKSK